MTNYASPSAWFCVGAYDLSPHTSKAGYSVAKDVNEWVGLTTTYLDYVQNGITRFEFVPADGIYDTTTTDPAYMAGLGIANIATIGLTGTAKNCKCVSGSGAMLTSYDRQIEAADFTKVGNEWAISGLLNHGILVADKQEYSGDVDTTAAYADLGAGGQTNAHVFIHCTGLTLGGYDDFTVKIQHSTNHSTWEDLVSFTALTDVGAEAKVVTGSINRYLAVIGTYDGEGSGNKATIAVSLCA